jgi:phospholipid/cholesterol/gamma-HCH transport system substrate-binding protein
VTRAVRKHMRDFVALAFVVLVAFGVAGYVLSNQRFYLPEWVPVLGSDFQNVDAELSTAQAVVPGQGQTVNIAGVKVGEIGKVRLVDGRARVQLKIRRKYMPVYRNASILLRPKTGLKDMFLELDPGDARAGRLRGPIPVSNTLPDVNPDEFLSSLDEDTRAYLRILLSSGAQALSGDSPAQLRQTLRRLEPTSRDVQAITSQVALRRHNVRRVIHNFQELATALAARDRQVSTFVDASNANFEAIASQSQNLRAALRLLPGTLDDTRRTLTSVDHLATQLGPALTKLRPGARALAPSLRQTRPFLRATTPVIRNEIRPFARDTQPATRDLRRAASDLAVVTPSLTRTFRVLNALVNTLAFNPKGREEGYLFWLAWANHDRSLLYGQQDANGPVRRGQIFVSCSALPVLENLPATNEPLGVLIELLNAPRQTQVCPGAAPVPTASAAKKKGGAP